MTPAVRDATPEDAAIIVEYNRRLAFETEDKFLDPAVLSRGVAAVLGDAARGRYFVAEVAGRVVGQLMITTEWSDWRDGWIWWIQSVYVEAEARRIGVFRSLYSHVSAEAARQGVVAIRLYVEDDNERAQATYIGVGMKHAGYKVMEQVILRGATGEPAWTSKTP